MVDEMNHWHGCGHACACLEPDELRCCSCEVAEVIKRRYDRPDLTNLQALTAARYALEGSDG